MLFHNFCTSWKYMPKGIDSQEVQKLWNKYTQKYTKGISIGIYPLGQVGLFLLAGDFNSLHFVLHPARVWRE